MKLTVIGSHLCPATLYALNRLSEAKAFLGLLIDMSYNPLSIHGEHGVGG